MQALLQKAMPLADVLWNSETEGRDFSTPERRAGLEAELGALVKSIRDPKIADYYKRDFDDRVFRAFKQRKFEPRQGSPNRGAYQGAQRQPYRGDSKQGFRGGPPSRSLPEGVSAAVKQSLHAVSAGSAARQLKERELMGLLLSAPGLIDRHAEHLEIGRAHV